MRPSTAGLSSPLLLSALPVRVATFALQGPERGKVQLLIHADVGTDYAGVAAGVDRLRASSIATAGSSTASRPTRGCRR